MRCPNLACHWTYVSEKWKKKVDVENIENTTETETETAKAIKRNWKWQTTTNCSGKFLCIFVSKMWSTNRQKKCIVQYAVCGMQNCVNISAEFDIAGNSRGRGFSSPENVVRSICFPTFPAKLVNCNYGACNFRHLPIRNGIYGSCCTDLNESRVP